jgi:glycosyltransferase involved in cell wall biosynthesis
MRIALVSTPLIKTPPSYYGGIERVVADLGFSLAKMGHDVTIVGTKGSKVKGCSIIETGPPKFKVKDWHKVEMDVFEVVRDKLGGFDVIHGHTNYFYPYEYRKLFPDAKIMMTYHGCLDGQIAAYVRNNMPTNFVSISGFMHDWYAGQGIASEIVYNGIDLSHYQFKREKGDRLLFVGRVTSFKQPYLAIQIARMLGLGLDILGGTKLKSDEIAYLQKVQNECDGKRIIFHANVSERVKVRFMRDATALIFPSLMGEPFGLVALEAMACGTPVVATNDGAIEEVVKEGGCVGDCYDETLFPDGGLQVFIKGNPAVTLSDCIFRARRINPDLCRLNAERFSRELMAQNYVRLYEKLMRGETW